MSGTLLTTGATSTWVVPAHQCAATVCVGQRISYDTTAIWLVVAVSPEPYSELRVARSENRRCSQAIARSIKPHYPRMRIASRRVSIAPLPRSNC